MAQQEVKLPAIAEGVDSGDVLSVLVTEGEEVDEGTPLFELESEKATVPLPSPAKGKVLKIQVKEGDNVKVGQTLLTLETNGVAAEAKPKATPEEKTEEKPEQKPKEKPEATGKPQKTVPEAAIAKEDKASEAESTGAAATDGKQPSEPQKLETKRPGLVASDRRAAPEKAAPVPAGPAVRRIARELGIDLGQVQGSGRRGRITVADLDPHIRGYVSQRGGAAPGAAVVHADLPDFSKYGPIRREKIESLRRKIADHLHQSWTSIPHVHQYDEADVTQLLALQKRYKEKVKQQGGQLTVTPFIMKAIVTVLREFPKFNSSYDPRTQEIIYKEYYHLGVAVDTEAGLVVPVVRDVDKKSINELAIELGDLAARTRQRKVSVEELRGSTFTITNTGNIGGGTFAPIINAPEVAILGVARAVRKPMYDSAGNLQPRDMCPLCLAYDHRVIDGAEGAHFIVRLVEVLENFEAAFLGL